MEGTLLFREDFGGNDPSDSGVSTTPVQGMSSAYSQVTNLAPKGNSNDMGSGHYLVAKQGYRNSTLTDYSIWHIMDDHTYPGDKTRGYLLEVDGKGGTDAFFQTTMSGLCAGSKLTFSAYIANLETAGQYAKWKREGRNSANPKISFVITNLTNGAELARYNSDTISHDWSNYPKNWRESADWQLVGMTFIVPEGVETVKLSIHNNVSASNGNDFALDDIEVRLCAPPVSIEGEAEVCTNSSAFLTTNYTNDGTFAEPLEYKWWFSADSVTWADLSTTTHMLSKLAVQKSDSGWYKVAVAGAGNIESVNCRAVSEPFKLKVEPCAPELCMEGTLLFREDFGGNDPNDPRVGTTPVNGMTYTQLLTDTWRSMGAGKYLLTKSGYCNGDTSMTNLPKNRSSQWHLQDDHTYPNDKTRGYLLEIDGKGGNSAFYSTTIEGLCEGSRLTFSAYVANVLSWGMYVGRPGVYAYPRLKFVLTDPSNNAELATYDTGDIPFDSAFINDYKCWQQSAEWRLVGMNFTVPPGQNRIKLTIYNNTTGTTGNDFALDDIEVRLCAPPVTIEGEAEVCTNSSALLTTNFTNDGTFAEPVEYKWFFSADSVSWETLNETSNVLNLSNVQKSDSGWYRMAVAGADNIESLNCRAVSEPFRLRVNECVEPLCIDGTLLFREDFGGNDPNDPAVSSLSVPGMSSQYHNSGNSLGSGNYTVRKQGWHNGIQWHLQDDHTYPGDYTRGYLLEVDGRGGAEPFYSKTIDGLCAGSKLTFSAYVVNVHYAGQLDYFGSSYVFPRMKFVLKDPTTGAVLAEKSTGDIQPDWRYGTPETWKYARDNQLSAEWQLIGMNFVVPDGIESIQMYIYNDVAHNGSGNDFALDDIEIHLCAPPVTIAGESEVCTNTSTTLTANFSNDGTFAEPLEYKWWHSTDSITWTERPDFIGKNPSIDAIQKADSGWYKAAVSGDGNIESVNCRAVSESFRLRVNECEPPEPPVEELCMDGILLFREDFGGNDPNDPIVGTDRVSGMDYSRYTQRLNADHVTGQAGLFWLIKSGYYHADTTRGRDPMKNHSNWYLQDDHTYPNDKTRGYLLEIDGLGGTAPFYSTVVHGVCPGTRLTFSAYVANVNKASNYIDGVHARIYPKLKFEIADAKTHTVLGSHSTGDIPYDPDLTVNTDFWYSSKWYLHGMTFTMPEAVDSIRLTIYNDVMNNGAGNDFALDDIEIRLCMTPDTIRTDTTVCDTLQQIAWRGKEYAVADTLRDTVYSHCGFDSIYYELHVATKHCEPPCPDMVTITTDTTVCDTLMPYRWRDTLFTEPATYEILYKNERGCDSLIRVLTLNTQICCPKRVTITVDTVVCDTLMPYRWRDTLFTEPATYEILYKNERGCDSLIRVLTLGIQVCCPNVVTITADTTVCDTLMPFTWTIGGQTFVFEQAETQEREMPHPKWTECTGTNYVLRLDTFHCEKLWQIIVNKYNWQLLLDNMSLSRFFPQNGARTYQWYKNEVPIPGANGDDYSEQNELCGRFQLRVEMDNGQTIWSNILEIGKSQVEEPIRVRIYDSHGVPVQENQVAHGVYLYRYEQGDRKWTEKRLIP